MSRTTTALKRLGVPGLAAVTMVAGLPLFLGTASAAHISGLTLTPETTDESAGVCVPYTAQLTFSSGQTPRSETIDVQLTESGTATEQGAQEVSFCTAPSGNVTPATPQGATSAGNTDRAEFVTDANGRVVFGIVSNAPSDDPLEIRAFYEVDGSTQENNQFDAGEFTDTSTATFDEGGAPGSNANQDAADRVEVIDQGEITPATSTATIQMDADTDTAVEGEARTFRVAVRNDENERLAGVTVSFTVDSSVNEADRGAAVFGVTDNNGIATGTITFPTRTGTGDSTDTVTFFVNQSGALSSPNRDTGEPADTVVVTVRDSAFQQNRTVTLTPETQTFTGGQRSATFTAVVDDPRATGADASTAGTLITFGVSGGSGDETVSVSNQSTGGGSNECTTVDNTATGGTQTNDSSCVVTVTDPTPTTGQTLTITATVRGSNGAADTSTLTFVNQTGDARTVTLTPETANVPTNTAQQLTATVRDVDGNPVRGVFVRFTENGAGAFRNGNSTAFDTTDENGIARVEVISLPGETGTMTVTASISETVTGQPNQCDEAANSGTDPQGNALNTTTNTGAAGDCEDTSTITFGGTSSPTATPTQGGTTSPTTNPSPSGTGTAPGCAVVAQVRLERTTITATGSTGVTVTVTPNSVVDLIAYSRPSTTFRVVRSAEVDADGVANFRIVPPTNTRLFAQQRGCAAGPQVVLNVRTQLSLNVVRNGPRLYTFSGRALPARNGGLIVSLYRVTASGNQILTAQTRANASTGQYTIVRRFTGSGRFGFVVRTGQDLQNAPGASNVRSLLVF